MRLSEFPAEDSPVESLEKSGIDTARGLENYEIIIHSIKSTSATIGADVPCKLAQKLETAAKENDLDYVLSNREAFLAGYNTLLDAVRTVITDSGESDDDGFGDDGVMEFAPDPD